MAHRIRIALAALALLPAAGARAQWRQDPMVVWPDVTAIDVLAGNFSAASGGTDLLFLDQSHALTQVRPFHALLTREPGAFTFPWSSGERPHRAGLLAQHAGDVLTDVARVGATGLEVAFGDDPGTLRTYALAPGSPELDVPAAFLHLLARPDGDVLVMAYYPSDAPSIRKLVTVDFDPVAVPTVALQRTWPLAVPLQYLYSQGVEAVPVRLSVPAQAYGIDDVALLGLGGILLFLHDETFAPVNLSSVQFGTQIEVPRGGLSNSTFGPFPWLPSTVERGDPLGVAVLDVDLDGSLDLVFPQSSTAPAMIYGGLVWVKGTGDPTAFGDCPWFDLSLHPALQLVEPMIVRQVAVGPYAAAAVWDRALQEVIVFWPEAGALRTWRAPAPGRMAKDIRLVDVVGSPAPDLVVVMDNYVLPGNPSDVVFVYPDLGQPGPALSWAAGSPGTPLRGVPHPMDVLLDPTGPASVLVEWIEGAPTTAPVAQGFRLLEHVFTPTCALPPPDLSVTVRATDDAGVFTALAVTLPLGTLQPALSLRGAAPAGRIVLEPEGATTAILDGVAATSCGTVSWGGEWPAGAVVQDEGGADWLRRTVTLPQAAYPELLAAPSLAVSLATTDPAVAAPQRVVTLSLELDGSSLVEVIHDADRTALAAGELAVLRTRLRSRVAVPLASVRMFDALSGLVPAGPPSIVGARIVSSAAGGADLVIDVLPPAPAEVEIDLPVRSVTGRGTSGVEARSSGGWLLSPAARADELAEALPGCGCGAGSGPGGLALVALALALRRGRRNAT